VTIDQPGNGETVPSDFTASGTAEVYLTDEGPEPPWDILVGINDQPKTRPSLTQDPVSSINYTWTWDPPVPVAEGPATLKVTLNATSHKAKDQASFKVG
jgi:hypothetical protein